MPFDPVDHRPQRRFGPPLPKRMRKLTTAECVLLIIVSVAVLFAVTWYDLMMMDRLIRDGWL